MTLTRAQLATIERRLHEERARAVSLIDRIVGEHAAESDQDATGDLSSLPSHMADLGTATMGAELDESNAARASIELQAIDAALTRLQEDPQHFDECQEDGTKIPYARLEMIPWANPCEKVVAPKPPRREEEDATGGG